MLHQWQRKKTSPQMAGILASQYFYTLPLAREQKNPLPKSEWTCDGSRQTSLFDGA
jgi:hypothetical protein